MAHRACSHSDQVPILVLPLPWGDGGRPYSSETHVPRAQPCSDIPDKPPPPRMRTLIGRSRLPLWALSSCQGTDTAREP